MTPRWLSRSPQEAESTDIFKKKTILRFVYKSAL